MLVIVILLIIILTAFAMDYSIIHGKGGENDYRVVSEDNLPESELRFACFRTQKDLDEISFDTPIKFKYTLVGFQGVCRQQFHKDLHSIGGRYISPYKVRPWDKLAFIRINYDAKLGCNFGNSIHCLIKNTMNDKQIIKILSKPELPKMFSDMVPKTLNMSTAVLPSGIWIAKPEGRASYSGRGMAIVQTQSEFDTWKAECKSQSWITGGVISQYIQNPKLIQGRKFHYRVHILMTTWNTISIFPLSHVVTARDEYKNSDFGNKAIHDTHAKSTIGMITENISDIPGMSDMLTEIANRLLTLPTSVWPDQDFGYIVFAPDILRDDDDKLHLLEINTRPGMLLATDWDFKARLQYETQYQHWEFQAVKAAFSKK